MIFHKKLKFEVLSRSIIIHINFNSLNCTMSTEQTLVPLCTCCNKVHDSQVIRFTACNRKHLFHYKKHQDNLCPGNYFDLESIPHCACCGGLTAVPSGRKCNRTHVHSYVEHPDYWCPEMIYTTYCQKFVSKMLRSH